MAPLSAYVLPCLSLAAVSYSSPVVPLAPRAEVVSAAKAEYDYVVIGGGTSGLVVANRLTENKDISVLVIERGDYDGDEGGSRIPGLPGDEKYRLDLTSKPQPGLNGHTSPIYQPNVVGGATVVNGMFFARGAKEDYDAWDKLGNKGWTWNDLLPYFKKSETFTGPTEEIQREYPGVIKPDPSVHGKTGPVGSSFSNYQYPVMKYFFKGWNAIKVRTQPEPNGGDPNGAFYSSVSLNATTQERSDASDAYFEPIAGKRQNFQLIPKTNVTKINFNSNKKAVSVEYSSGGKSKNVKASREIILAAGAIHSPRLLQLSGVGPKKLVSDKGIKSIVDLPGVGMNFQDQPAMFIQYEYGAGYPFPSVDWKFNETWATEQLAIYNDNRTGPYTIPNFSGSIVSFLPLRNGSTEQARTDVISSVESVDLKKLLPAADATVVEGYRAQRKELLTQYKSDHTPVMEIAWAGGNTVSLAMLKPLSRGNVTIASKDPLAAPIIDYGTFSADADLKMFVAMVKKTRDFMNSPPMQEIGSRATDPTEEQTDTDAKIAAWIREHATSTWAHPTSTCSMLKKELGGVVDTNLFVYGVKGLRVVDASIMPIIVAGHTSSTVYAVAEKAADIIKKAYKA